MKWQEINPRKLVCNTNITLSYNWKHVKDIIKMVKSQRNKRKQTRLYRVQMTITKFSRALHMFTALGSGCGLSRTQTSLSRWKRARKGRREGDNRRDVLRLPSVPFPWSLAVHHQSLAFRARLYDAKNEAPEEEAGVLVYPLNKFPNILKKALNIA